MPVFWPKRVFFLSAAIILYTNFAAEQKNFSQI